MPQNMRMIATIASLFLFPAALAAGPTSAPPPPPGPGAGGGPMNGGCMGIMRMLTPEQHAMHFLDMKVKMDTLTVTKFRDWKKAECDKFAKDPAAGAAYAKDLQARWDKLSDKEKLAAYHDMLAKRPMMGPRHGKPGGKQDGRGRGMGPGQGSK